MYCCVYCETPVKGSLYGVRPKFCCVGCCANFNGAPSRHYHRRLVSVSRASQRYHLTTEDLKLLNYKTEGNPVDANGRRMRLFLGAEVEYLRDMKVEAIKRQAVIECILNDVQEREAIEKKKERAERLLGTKLGELDAVIRECLLGDYLKRSSGTTTTLPDVQRRFTVLDRVQEIRKAIPSAYPGAVFDFCLAYPEGDLAQFEDLQVRCQKVFFSVGEIVYSKLSEVDRQKLLGLSLIEAMDRPRMSTVEATIFWHLNTCRKGDLDYLLLFAVNDAESPSKRIRISRGRRTSLQ